MEMDDATVPDTRLTVSLLEELAECTGEPPLTVGLGVPVPSEDSEELNFSVTDRCVCVSVVDTVGDGPSLLKLLDALMDVVEEMLVLLVPTVHDPSSLIEREGVCVVEVDGETDRSVESLTV